MIGKNISHYKIIDKLGEGGMGVVYKAEDTKLQRQVALKFLPQEWTRDPDAKARFMNEARAASALQHHNICTIHEIDETEDGQMFICMDFYEGETVKQKIERGPLKLEEAVNLAIQIAEGLDKAHQKTIVHRDLKPANVLVTEDEVAKILDFGLAKLAGRTMLTREGATLGTAAYMSPEQARGEDVDHGTDIFSLGVLLYEMVTGQQPFRGDYEQAVLYGIMNEDPEPVTGLRTGVSLELEGIITKALEKDSSLRYQSIRELSTDLKRIERDRSSKEISTIQTKLEGRKKDLRTPVLAGFVALMIIAFTLWYWFSSRQIPLTSGIMNVVQLTANPIERSITGAAISPDGKYLAYAEPAGVHLRSIETGEVHELALPADLHVWDVEWYPSGNQLLINGIAASAELPSLWSVSIFGGKPRKLYEGSYWPAVSPDGQLIAFIRADTFTRRALREIWIMGANGENPRSLVMAGEEDSYWGVDWSPDSRRVAYGNWYRRSEGTGYAIESATLDGKEQTVIVSEPRLFQHWTGVLPFVWSRDGRLIYARRELPPNSQSSNLWAIRTDLKDGEGEGDPVRITQLVGFNFRELSLSAEGNRLVSLLLQNQADVYVAELDDKGTSLKNEQRLTFDERHDYPSGWTLDGRGILFYSNRRGNRDIFKRDLEQENEEVLISGQGEQEGAWPSPDGKWFLYQSGMDLMRSPVSGGAAEKVLTFKAGLPGFRCAPASQNPCVLGELDTERNEYAFFELDPVQGRGKELTRIKVRPPFNEWDLSRDGTQVAVVHNDDHRIRIVSLQTGQEHQIMVKGWRGFEFVSWAADDKSLFVNGGNLVGRSYPALLRVDLNGNVTVLRQKPYEWHVRPKVSPDGRKIAFASMPFHGNVWMVEDF